MVYQGISFIHSIYFYSASSSPLLLRGASDYSIDTVLELTRQSATGNCEWRTCSRSLHGGWSGIRTCDPPDARHRTYHWATMPMPPSSSQCDDTRVNSCSALRPGNWTWTFLLALWFDAVLLNKMVPFAWLLNGTLEVLSLRLKSSLSFLQSFYTINPIISLLLSKKYQVKLLVSLFKQLLWNAEKFRSDLTVSWMEN